MKQKCARRQPAAPGVLLCSMCYCKLIYLRSIAKQVIPTYINHSRPLIPDGIYLIFLTRFERREKPDLSLYAER